MLIIQDYTILMIKLNNIHVFQVGSAEFMAPEIVEAFIEDTEEEMKQFLYRKKVRFPAKSTYEQILQLYHLHKDDEEAQLLI